ncbi:hemin receptor [Proteus mirabilis]|uniref:Hemin receptor n=1 Tax=Proteus mirabilis TaxID=584 RepID=A0A379GHM3_PROMI|nr:hemin receptor [Proteus mirabilis]
MTSADKYQETYQNISKNIALRLTLTKWLQIYSSYSVAFRAPTLSEMYNDSVHFTIISPFNKKSYDARWVPNSTLEPETNRTWEHGINLQKNALLFTNDQLNIKASYYSTESIDHITYQQWYHSRKPIQLKNSHIALSPIKDAREPLLFQSVNLPKALIHGFDLRLLYSHPYIAMAG